jgi:hypothetical protein
MRRKREIIYSQKSILKFINYSIEGDYSKALGLGGGDNITANYLILFYKSNKKLFKKHKLKFVNPYVGSLQRYLYRLLMFIYLVPLLMAFWDATSMWAGRGKHSIGGPLFFDSILLIWLIVITYAILAIKWIPFRFRDYLLKYRNKEKCIIFFKRMHEIISSYDEKQFKKEFKVPVEPDERMYEMLGYH